MKVSAILLAAASAASVSAGSLFSAAGTKQAVVTDDKEFKVPGDNPLYFCSDPKDYSLKIESVELSPNPPVPGSVLSITAKGDFEEEVEDGSKTHLFVKYNKYITLINQDADTCESVKKVDLECPLKKGEMKLTKDVDIPAQVPPGSYSVEARVRTKDDELVTCLKADITFHR